MATVIRLWQRCRLFSSTLRPCKSAWNLSASPPAICTITMRFGGTGHVMQALSKLMFWHKFHTPDVRCGRKEGHNMLRSTFWSTHGCDIGPRFAIPRSAYSLLSQPAQGTLAQNPSNMQSTCTYLSTRPAPLSSGRDRLRGCRMSNSHGIEDVPGALSSTALTSTTMKDKSSRARPSLNSNRITAQSCPR